MKHKIIYLKPDVTFLHLEATNNKEKKLLRGIQEDLKRVGGRQIWTGTMRAGNPPEVDVTSLSVGLNVS